VRLDGDRAIFLKSPPGRDLRWARSRS